MKREEVRDAAATMKELGVRLFNQDSEGLLIERLGPPERAWAHEAASKPCEWIRGVTGVLNSWIIPELVFPGGPLEENESLRGHEWSEEERQQMRLIDDKTQLLNSYGVGVFIGATLRRMLIINGEAVREVAIFGPDFSLLDAVFALDKSALSPSDLTYDSGSPWFRNLQRWMILARPRLGLEEVFRSIVNPEEREGGVLKRLTYRQLRRARRSMLLAGLISSGFSLPNEDFMSVSVEAHDDVEDKLAEDGAIELYNLSDEELEALLGEMHLRESIQEELRFRLRSSRLSRMLAHLERTSQGEDEDEDNGASGNE